MRPDHPTLALLGRRHATGSRPLAREDDARLALLIEGGSSRGSYSSGMVLAVEELGLLPCFDDVYGSSAGALNGAWLLCERAGVSMHAWWDPAIMRAIINPRRALRLRPVVDTHHLVHHIYEQVVPMDFAAVLASPVRFHPIATDAQTGAAVDLAPYLGDPAQLQAALRASTCMPVLSGPPVSVAGRRYVDAGVAASVPILPALADGVTHVIALRTRRADEVVTNPRGAQRAVVSRYLARHAPGAREPWLRRAEWRDREETALRAHDAVQIRPPLEAGHVGRTERGPLVLKRAVESGRAAALAVLAG